MGLSQSNRRLAAIMYTDMVGYTALGQKNESLSLSLLEEQRKLIRPALTRHNGREVKTMGDAFLVEFPSALDAVRCAYDIQRATRELNISLPEERKIRLRVGIHLGDVVETEGDISGDAVNVASRIEPLAEDGGVCMTRQVYDHVQNKFDLPLTSLGSKSLKSLASSVEVFRMVMPWAQENVFPALLDKRRVAVLPFANMSPDPGDEYFSDGMTEELIASLSSVKELTVIARTSMMKYKSSAKGALDVGRELNAGTLIEGSVRKSGDRVRITVQLIDARTEGQVWAQNYDRHLEDIFAIQTEIAKKVATKLKAQLVESEKIRLERKPAENTGTYMLYLKGRFFWNERTKESVNRAIECYNAAIKRDASFVLGYSGLADCYGVMGRNQYAEPGPSYLLAKKYALKALDLDPNLAEAHAILAAVLGDYEHDPEGAEAGFKKAIELKPSYAWAHQLYSVYLRQHRRFDESIRESRRALELDPFSLMINVNLGDTLGYAGNADGAIQQLKKAEEMDPGFIPVHFMRIDLYVHKGMYEQALIEGEICSQGTKSPLFKRWVTAYVAAAKGERAESIALLDDIHLNYKRENIHPYEIARVHFLARDNEGGFQWLQRAYEEHDSWIHLMAIDPELEGVRNDPQYRQILKRVGLGNVRFSS